MNMVIAVRWKDIRRIVSNVAMILLVAAYIVDALTGYKIDVVTATLSATVLIANIPFMGKTFRLPAWIFTAIGVVGLILTQAPFE